MWAHWSTLEMEIEQDWVSVFALEMWGGRHIVFFLLALEVCCSSETWGLVLQNVLAWAHDSLFLLCSH